MKQSIYKVPGGKMLRIFLDTDADKIVSLRITGDFFMHPEENLSELEKTLVGIELKEQVLLDKIEDFLRNKPTELYGFAPEDLVKTILNK